MKHSNLFIVLIVCISAAIAGCGSGKNQNTVNQKKEKDTLATQQPTRDTVKEIVNITPSPTSVNNASLADDDLHFIYATSQKWHGGVKGSGSGVYYEICFIAGQPSSSLIIDELWIGDVFHETTVSRKFPMTSKDGFSKGDTIFLYANDYTKDPNGLKDTNDMLKSETVKQDGRFNKFVPYKYSGEALIGYKLNGERKYKEIAKITAKSPLFYP